MVLFRELESNAVPEQVETLRHRLHVDLATTDRAFDWGVIGTTIVPVRYLALAGSGNQQLGSQLMISFWAFGDSEAETMLNLERLFKNLSRALLSATTPRR
jgi:hypothetical protein